MKMEVPSYKIKYIQCPLATHEGEKVNLICLSKNCEGHPLICSLCAASDHFGHPFKPLKMYLDDLYRQYVQAPSHFQNRLEDLQKNKTLLLLGLKDCVEKIAEEFMHLEEEVVHHYEVIKGQLMENESKRNKFSAFYATMVREHYGDPHFEILDYIIKEEQKTLPDQHIFQSLTHKVVEDIKKMREDFLVQRSEPFPEDIPKPVSGQFLKAPGVMQEEDSFWQTNFAPQSPSMVLMDLEIGKITGKIRIIILSLAPNAKLTCGLIKKSIHQSCGGVFSEGLDALWVDSLGKHKNDQYSHIANLQANSTIDFFVKKSNFRIITKSHNAVFNLADRTTSFFFALEGNCKIKVIYPYLK